MKANDLIDNYNIYSNGDVRSHKTGRLLKIDCSTGYARVTLSRDGVKKKFYVHRLVAMKFIKNESNKPCVNHIDGNKLNNHYTNLEWCTNSENQIHAHETGLKLNGNKLWNGKFSKEDVNRMKYLDNHISRVEIAKRMGCSKSTVSEILNGNRYKHI